MKPYRTNLPIDIFRLVRGLMGGAVDPFINNWPPMITARGTIFKWSDIDEDTHTYTIKFDGYTPYVSPQPFKMEYLPVPYARDAFKHLMQVLPERVSGITALLESDGVRVAPDLDSWQDIGRWIARHMEARPLAPGETVKRLRPLWHSLTLDLALLMGEQTIALRGVERTSWQFYADLPFDRLDESGRELWLLCEPVPKHTIRADPNRMLPVALMNGVVSGALHGRPIPHDPIEDSGDAARALFASVLEGS